MPTIGRHVAKLSGYAPALPTPFDDNSDVDREAFERLYDLQITCGATALVVCGTTSEEQSELIRIAVAVSRGRVPVIAGAGSNATDHAIASAKDAEAAGADAALSVVPYYNRPTQAGLYAHFREIAASTGLPVILYDVPSRTACALADATIARLAELPRIIGLKDASGDVTRPSRLRALVVRISGCCRETMRSAWYFWRRAATVASRSRQMWRPACAATCFWPGAKDRQREPSASHARSHS
jgi:4-hydroxy-tetrahydrodipicolinate synthase